jgi:hypothetical protein
MESNFKYDEDILKILLVEVILRKNYGFKVIDSFEKEEECEICCENKKDKTVMIPPCGHILHYECFMKDIIQYNRKYCPICSIENKKDELKFQQEKDLSYPNEKKDDVCQNKNEENNYYNNYDQYKGYQDFIPQSNLMGYDKYSDKYSDSEKEDTFGINWLTGNYDISGDNKNSYDYFYNEYNEYNEYDELNISSNSSSSEDVIKYMNGELTDPDKFNNKYPYY